MLYSGKYCSEPSYSMIFIEGILFSFALCSRAAAFGKPSLEPNIASTF